MSATEVFRIVILSLLAVYILIVCIVGYVVYRLRKTMKHEYSVILFHVEQRSNALEFLSPLCGINLLERKNRIDINRIFASQDFNGLLKLHEDNNRLEKEIFIELRNRPQLLKEGRVALLINSLARDNESFRKSLIEYNRSVSIYNYWIKSFIFFIFGRLFNLKEGGLFSNK
ncbi:MAG: hypothetical protein LKF54_03055 [Bacilli bacterium]|jgi:hypothetical protein|nr:hypothetical protein [Bacilli bacterium]